MPRSQQAAAGSVRSSGRASTSASASSQRPVWKQQLAQGAVRLSQPERRADLVRELPGLPGRGQRLLVPVEAAQRDGLVRSAAAAAGRSAPDRTRSRPAPGRTAAAPRSCRPCTEVTSASTSSAQPMAQLSPASVAASRALGGDPARLFHLAAVAGASARRARAAGPGAGPRSRARPAPGPARPANPRTRPPACGTGPASSAGPPAGRARWRTPARGWPPARPRPGHRCGTGRRRAGWLASRAGPSRPGCWRRPG